MQSKWQQINPQEVIFFYQNEKRTSRSDFVYCNGNSNKSTKTELVFHFYFPLGPTVFHLASDLTLLISPGGKRMWSRKGWEAKGPSTAKKSQHLLQGHKLMPRWDSICLPAIPILPALKHFPNQPPLPLPHWSRAWGMGELNWSKIAASSCSSFYALFGRNLNEELSIHAEDQDLLSEVHFTCEIMHPAPTEISAQFHWLSFFCRRVAQSRCSYLHLSAIPGTLQGSSDYLLSISEAESGTPHAPFPKGTLALGTMSHNVLFPGHPGATAFPSAQPSALPLLQQQWKIPFSLKGELHARAGWQD